MRLAGRLAAWLNWFEARDRGPAASWIAILRHRETRETVECATGTRAGSCGNGSFRIVRVAVWRTVVLAARRAGMADEGTRSPVRTPVAAAAVAAADLLGCVNPEFVAERAIP